VTGEAGGGGGGGYSNLAGIANNRGEKQFTAAANFLNDLAWEQVQPYLFWIVLGFVLLAALLFLWVYSDCVYRFILLDSVLTGRCALREGWRRWKYAGRRYLLWVLGFAFSAMVLLGLVAGIPILLAYRTGWFQNADQHLGRLIGGGVLLGLVVIVLIVVVAVIDLFGRDFLIPVMAFEEVGAIEGWERLIELMGDEKGAFTFYVLMKIALSAASGIIFGIVNFIVILILLIPLGALGLAGYFIGKGAGVTWDNPSVILLLAAFAMLAVAGILYVVGLVYAPALVFLQSYTLIFFGTRYEPLRSKMYPAAPSPALAPVTPLGGLVPPPEPSPV
jgi:hypothetical protein